jgi:hypothetical protein
MPEVADVLRRHGREYLERFGAELLPNHHRAVDDLLSCRTRALGGSCSNVITVATSTMSTTPAATGAVPSATTTTPMDPHPGLPSARARPGPCRRGLCQPDALASRAALACGVSARPVRRFPCTGNPSRRHRISTPPGWSDVSTRRPGPAGLDPRHSPTPTGAAMRVPPFSRPSLFFIIPVTSPTGGRSRPPVRPTLAHRPSKSAALPSHWPWYCPPTLPFIPLPTSTDRPPSPDAPPKTLLKRFSLH